MSRKIYGEVRGGEFVTTPSFVRNIRRTKGSKRAGQLFEDKVQRKLLKEFRGQYVNGPWILYDGPYCGQKYCQPDGLLFDPWEGRIVIVECKLSHTAKAWSQINELYRPVLEAMFPDWEIVGVEIFKFFSAAESYPVKPQVIWDLTQAESGGDYIMRFE